MKPAAPAERSVVSFALLTYVLGWSCWAPVVLAEFRLIALPANAVPLLVTLGLFSPALAATLQVVRGRGPAPPGAFFRQATRWRVAPWWYAAALLVPAGIRLTAVATSIGPQAAAHLVGDLGTWLGAPLALAAVILFGSPVGEEFGWRGYALPLLQRGLDPVRSALAVGLIACVWHAPLFALPFMPQGHVPFLLFGARTLAVAVISAWLYNRTQSSLLIVILFHAAQNVGPNSVTILAETGNLLPYSVATGLYALLALGLLRSLRRSVAWEP